MSDHGHSDSHAAEKKGVDAKSFRVDQFIQGLFDYVSEGIAKLIAFILIIITIGAIMGYFIAQKQFSPAWLFAPAMLGVIAYYERDIAMVLFVTLLVIVVL